MNADDLTRAIAERDQSKASMGDMADHLCAFYERCLGTMSEAHAFELTNTLLIESLAKE